jgi:putative thioredoxin
MSNYIFDVDSASFDHRVVARSSEVPVLVDFWADWCAPCKMLVPVLKKIVDESGGGIELAKVDTDRQQELAARFGIRSLPTVMLFRNGELVDQFTGAQSESMVRRFLDPYLVRESDATLALASEAWQSGRQQEAIELARDAVAQDPGYDRSRLQLAEWLLAIGALSGAEDALAGISPQGQLHPDYKSLSARLELEHGAAETDASVDDLQRAVAADGADLDSRYHLALRLVSAARYPEALEQLLEIVHRDKQFNDGAARAAMLKVFELLGGQGELVGRYRGLLARALN